MTPGSIVHYKDFIFHDGDHSDKLLIVLNAGGKKPYLVVKTTSKQKGRREAKEGCHAKDGYYFLPANRDQFVKDTWILLYEFYELSTEEFLKAGFAGIAEHRGTLKAETCRAIINCAKKGEDWTAHHDGLVS